MSQEEKQTNTPKEGEQLHQEKEEEEREKNKAGGE